VGIALAALGFSNARLAKEASSEPEEISLKDLIARGPDGNPNIILTDFVLCETFVVKSEGSRWTGAWVPVVPRVPGEPEGRRAGVPVYVQAVIFTSKARDESELYARCGQAKLRAMVTNRIVSLGDQEAKLLHNSYAGLDLNHCLIIQEGREPAGRLQVFLMIGGGIILALAGAGLVGFHIYSSISKPRKARRRKRRPASESEAEDVPRALPRARRRRQDESG
jgi:hypothetical protein